MARQFPWPDAPPPPPAFRSTVARSRTVRRRSLRGPGCTVTSSSTLRFHISDRARVRTRPPKIAQSVPSHLSTPAGEPGVLFVRTTTRTGSTSRRGCTAIPSVHVQPCQRFLWGFQPGFVAALAKPTPLAWIGQMAGHVWWCTGARPGSAGPARPAAKLPRERDTTRRGRVGGWSLSGSAGLAVWTTSRARARTRPRQSARAPTSPHHLGFPRPCRPRCAPHRFRPRDDRCVAPGQAAFASSFFLPSSVLLPHQACFSHPGWPCYAASTELR